MDNCETVNGFEDHDEFDEAKDPPRVFCKQMSEAEFENVGVSETEKALNELMAYMDSHPDEFEEMLRKRKRQDLENGGVISFLKVKVMDVVHGSNSPLLQVTAKEREKRLKEMKHNMMKAFDYSLESKGRRVSKRLEEKRVKKGSLDKKQSSKGGPPVAPPPPPPPPPILSAMGPPPAPPLPVNYNITVTPRRPFKPLEERLNRQKTEGFNSTKKVDVNDSFGSIASFDTSLTSLHEELLSSNPWKRLKCVGENRSPGGTPSNAKKALVMNTPKEPLYMALMNKFKNTRSPSPQVSANTSQTNIADESQTGFTP